MKTNNLLIFLVLFISCNKDHERACWKSNGEISTYTIEHPPLVNKLTISDDIDVILINDSLNFSEIEGPENLIRFIDISEQNNKITISNHNKCDFLRSKKNISVYFHYEQIQEITLEGYGSISNLGAIQQSLIINANNVLSSLNLNLNNDSTSVYLSSGSTDVNLQGSCSNLYIYNSGLAPVKALALQTLKTHVHSNTISKIEVHATESLNVEIRNEGNVYYTGSPTNINLTITGNGEAIQL
mgnify:CR=1 FL=1